MIGRVVSTGNFDGCHLGHQKIFQKLKDIGKEKHLIPTVVSFEPHTRHLLGTPGKPTLLTSLEEKKEAIESYGLDFISLPFDFELASMPYDSFVNDILVKTLKTEYMVFGHDHHFGAKGHGSYELFVKTFPNILSEKLPALYWGSILINSSVIRESLLKGELEQSLKLLGRPYRINGRVIPGKQLGRTLGFPTANLSVDPYKLIPQPGVYFGRVILADHSIHRAVINIGFRPSVGGETLLIEAHLLHFSGDLYHQKINIDLIQFLRPEKKFDSLNELKAQISADAESASFFFDPLLDA